MLLLWLEKGSLTDITIPTPGAYQRYGNPGFILVQEPEAVVGKSQRYFSRREYFDKLKSIAADAKAAEADRRDMLRQNIRQLSDIDSCSLA